MEEIVMMSGDFGFSITLFFYLLLGFVKKFDKITNSLENLSIQIKNILTNEERGEI